MIKNISKPLKEIDKSGWFYSNDEPPELQKIITGEYFLSVMNLEYLESISEEIYLNIWYKLNGN
jgi:hypothetical protein